MTRSGKLGTKLKSWLHQKFLSHEVVTRSRMKKQKTWLFSSLLLVNFPAFRYPWIAIRLESISNTCYMHGWKLSRCVNVNQLLIERAISHFCPRVEISNIISQSKLNEKLVFRRLIKVASLTMFCVPLPSYNFVVSIEDDFYCGYFALRDER